MKHNPHTMALAQRPQGLYVCRAGFGCTNTWWYVWTMFCCSLSDDDLVLIHVSFVLRRCPCMTEMRHGFIGLAAPECCVRWTIDAPRQPQHSSNTCATLLL